MELSLRNAMTIIPVLIACIAALLAFNGWASSNTDFMKNTTNNMTTVQVDINKELMNKSYPEIQGSTNIRIKKGTSFEPRMYISARDAMDGDISARLNFFGTVNVNEKGVYKLKCVIVNSIGLKTTKFIQILVD